MTTTHPTPETSLLTRLDLQRESNPDDWPEFELTNARVTSGTDPHPSTSDLVSLLTATEHHPLTLIGSLQPLPRDLHHRYIGNSTRRAETIQISPVSSFAYGQYADGTVALWAAGRAGWFEIKPSRAYRGVFSDMAEGVKMLYFVADAYREGRRGKGKKSGEGPPSYSAEELFALYATEAWGRAGEAEIEAARDQIEGQKDFLFTAMLGGKEGMEWRRNPLYLYLKKKYPDAHDQVLHRLLGPSKKQRAERREGSVVSESSSLKRKRGRPPKNPARGTDVNSLDSSSVASSAAARPSNPRQTEPPRPRSQSSKASQPPPSRNAAGIIARRTRQNSAAPEPSPADADSEPAAAFTPIPEVSDSEDEARRQARKGRSSLRLKPAAPSAGKSAKAAQGTKGKAPATAPDDDDDDDEDDEDELNRSPTQKRPQPPPDSDADPPTREAHRSRRPNRHTSQPDRPRRPPAEGQAEAASNLSIPLTPSASDPASPTTSTTPSSPSATAGAPAPEPETLHHRPDPLQEDTWVCALAGCAHKVYRASHAGSQRLIREHYVQHAYEDADDRVRLVRTLGEAAPSRPVGHLMERVRLRAREEGFPGSGGAWNGGSRFGLGGAVGQRY